MSSAIGKRCVFQEQTSQGICYLIFVSSAKIVHLSDATILKHYPEKEGFQMPVAVLRVFFMLK